MSEAEMKRRSFASSVALLCVGSLYYISALRLGSFWPSAVALAAFVALMLYARPLISARAKLQEQLRMRGVWSPPSMWEIILPPVALLALMFLPLMLEPSRTALGVAYPIIMGAGWLGILAGVAWLSFSGFRLISRDFSLLGHK